MGFVSGFGMFGVMFTIAFICIFGIIIATVVRGIGQWNKNNHSPRLTVEAVVVAKRADVYYHHHNHGDNMHHSSRSTSYFVTFEVESGDRLELSMSGSEFGLLVEGDRGKLSFQGTRYLGFERM